MMLSILFASSFALAVSTATPEACSTACSASMNGELPSQLPTDFEFSGNVRRYYVAAEEIEWNYVPTGWDNWLGVPINLSPRARESTKYNTTYIKALYRGYTDSTFEERTPQPEWQGAQGPTIRAEVGDMIEIMFTNRLSKNYATMHSMGLAYNKRNEGADYPLAMNKSLPLGSAVPPVEEGIGPGECVVYKWLVDEIAGPNNGAPSRTHSYHSYVDLRADTNAGLVGPSIIYAAGQMNTTMQTYHEFPLLYNIYNENQSFLSGENARRLKHNNHTMMMPGWGALETETLWTRGNYSIWHPQMVNLNGTQQFADASEFHALNGYIFSNNPPFTLPAGAQAIWHTYAYGAEPHSFHLHGNAVVDAGTGRKTFAVALGDGVHETLVMEAANRGLWQVVCHVADHQQNGMVGVYFVTDE